jgi:hypothetical protein
MGIGYTFSAFGEIKMKFYRLRVATQHNRKTHALSTKTTWQQYFSTREN